MKYYKSTVKSFVEDFPSVIILKTFDITETLIMLQNKTKF